MYNIFFYLNNIKEIDLSEFDVSEVISMSFMFYYCVQLKNIIFRKIISSLIDISYILDSCDSLVSIDLSNFGISKVNSIEGTFSGSSQVT